MKRDLQKLQNQEFDVLVLGGGVSGASIAWDCALRGYNTALIERRDFGHATSAATSKLIHGGLRYLAKMEIGVVRESLRERRLLEQNMPHQSFPLSFLLPVYEDTPTPKWMLGIGLTLYDWLSYDKNDLTDPDKHLGNHRWLKKGKLLEMEPGINPNGLKGGFHYYDVMNRHPNRSNLEYVLSASAQGATVANYVACSEFMTEESDSGKKITGVIAKDELTGKEFPIKAKVTVNATGPWGDLVLSKIHKNPVRKISRSKGIHLLFPKFHKNTTISYETRDKQHFFIIPWLKYSLIGTTDTPFHGDPDDLSVTRDDVESFLKLINSYYPGHLQTSQIVNTYAGIRPLVADTEVTSTYKASRKHEIIYHKKVENLDGLVSVFGGKWTTSRSLAEETTSLIKNKFNLPDVSCKTRETPVIGGKTGNRLSEFINTAHQKWDNMFPVKLIDHLIEIYGSGYELVLHYAMKDRSMLKLLDTDYPFIVAEIYHAVENEMALTLTDFLKRRSGLGNMGIIPETTIHNITEIMADLLKWDSARKRQEIQQFTDSRRIIE